MPCLLPSLIAHPAAHRAAVQVSAHYLESSEHLDQIDTVPEWSRRARSVPVHAGLRTLGRTGVADLVDRNIRHSRRMAGRLAAEPGIEVLNDVWIPRTGRNSSGATPSRATPSTWTSGTG